MCSLVLLPSTLPLFLQSFLRVLGEEGDPTTLRSS
jgi:hypothetical protein